MGFALDLARETSPAGPAGPFWFAITGPVRKRSCQRAPSCSARNAAPATVYRSPGHERDRSRAQVAREAP